MASIKADKRKIRPLTPLTIILEDMDLSWSDTQIKLAQKMWESGFGIEEMALKLRPYDSTDNAIDETALLIFHLARQKKVKNRDNGVAGDEREVSTGT